MCKTCATWVEKRMAYRVLVWNPVRKRPLGSPRNRWEDNIKMDSKGIEWEVMD